MTDSVFVDRGVSEPAQLTNMRLGLSTMLECQDAPAGSPRMGLFYGLSGYGKSVAAATIAARMNGAYVVARSIWRTISLLRAIAEEIGITDPKRQRDALLEQIIRQLNNEPQPLIIDEFDHLVRKGTDDVEVIRDILDHGRVPVLLIGEESLPAKLKKLERFDNRILIATPAQPASLNDARLLRTHYCKKVEVADDLLDDILRQCRGITRRIVINLAMVQAETIAEGRDTIDLAGWGGRRLRTGDVVTRKAA